MAAWRSRGADRRHLWGMTQRVLVDCDPGIDDALALYALLASDAVSVQGITTVFGNVTVRQATRNVARLLRLLARTPVPRLAEGSDQPLVGSRLPRRLTHGHDGLGDVDIPLASVPRPLQESTSLVTDLLSAGALDTVIALGPLTNVAHAFASVPKLLRQLRAISVMGGIIVEGTGSTATEFNIASDPAAVRCVLGSQVLLRWVPMNVAAAGLIIQQDVDRFQTTYGSTPLGQGIASLLSYAVRARSGTEAGAASLPDAVAAVLVIDPSLGVWCQRRLVLERQTRSGRLRVEPGLPNAEVCEGLNVKRLRERLWGLWGRLVRANT